MENNKKTAPSAATLEAVSGLKKDFLSCSPHSDYNTDSQRRKKNSQKGIKICDLLYKGEENAIPARDLAKLIGLSNTRALRARITREREAGELILSTMRNGGGYFLPDNGLKGKREVDTYIRTQCERAFTTLRITRPAVQELDKIDGQTTL